MQKVNHPLKARMYIGGLKSLFVDLVNEIEQIETNGVVSNKFVENLADVKSAIDLTLTEFKKVTVRCCEHGSEHDVCDESCADEQESDECPDCHAEWDECDCEEGHIENDVDICPECDELEDECVCEEPEEPPAKPSFRKETVPAKKELKVVTPVRKKGK